MNEEKLSSGLSAPGTNSGTPLLSLDWSPASSVSSSTKLLLDPSASASAAPSRVTLNVGGSIFVSTVATLSMQKGSFFGRLLAGQFEESMDLSKQIFIDRDATFFRHILNYLRVGPSSWRVADTGLSIHELSQLRSEAEFYQLEALVNLISQFIHDNDSSTAASECGSFVAISSPFGSSGLLASGILLVDGFKSVTLSPSIGSADSSESKRDRSWTFSNRTVMSQTCLKQLEKLVSAPRTDVKILVVEQERSFLIKKQHHGTVDTLPLPENFHAWAF